MSGLNMNLLGKEENSMISLEELKRKGLVSVDLKIDPASLQQLEVKLFSLPPKYADFLCPYCGSKKYERITNANGVLGPNGYVEVVWCYCSRCNRGFKDPKKYTETKLNEA